MAETETESVSINLRFKSKNAVFTLILLLSAVLFFSNLWVGDLGLDSCAYATISRSILRTNDWVVPHYEHCQEFADCWLHPPLFYWMTALSFKLFGVNEFAARFISALLGVGTICLVFLIGCRAGGSWKEGFLSSFVLLSTQQFLDLSRKCQLDVPLAFFTTLSVLFLVLALQKEKYYVLMGISTGLAVLTKGLPGLAVFGIVFLYFIFEGDYKYFLSSRLFLSLIPFFLTLCIWVIPLILEGELKNFIHYYFRSQIWNNLTPSPAAKDLTALDKIHGFFWYIIVLAKRYWPWFPFLVVSFYLGIKKRKANKLFLIFVLWISILLLAFSLGGTKFYRYLAPAYPAFALLIGVVWAKRISDKTFKAVIILSTALSLILLLATSLSPLYFGKIGGPDKTEIKKISPYIKSLTQEGAIVSVYNLNYWGAVADFAFYVDRPIRRFETGDSFSLALEKGEAYGYIKKEDYSRLSEDFKKNFPAVLQTKNFFLISNRENARSVSEKIFPFFIF